MLSYYIIFDIFIVFHNSSSLAHQLLLLIKINYILKCTSCNNSIQKLQGNKETSTIKTIKKKKIYIYIYKIKKVKIAHYYHKRTEFRVHLFRGYQEKVGGNTKLLKG